MEKEGPSHLLCVAGPPAGLSGRSMGHPCCSTAAGEVNSLPPSLGGKEKRLAALRAPRRTSRGMASSDQPPEGGDLPCLTCAPGLSGFSEPVCPPLSPSQQLQLRPVLWIGGVGWERGTRRVGGRDQSGVSGWGPLPLHHPSSPQLVKSPALSFLPNDSALYPSFLPYGPGSGLVLSPWDLIVASPLVSQPPVSHSSSFPQGPRADLPLPCSRFFHGSPAPHGQSLDSGLGIEGPAWPGPIQSPHPKSHLLLQ